MLSIVYASQAGEVLSGFGYGYDGAGNRQYKAFADGTQESYGYDVLNRLTGVDCPGGKYAEYGYDAVGNRQSLIDSTRTLTRWAATASASVEPRGAGSPGPGMGAPPFCNGIASASPLRARIRSGEKAHERTAAARLTGRW